MAWESRIANESVRRLVLAAIMLSLLAASVAVAAWMSATGPDAQTHRLGGFQFSLPAHWHPQSGTGPSQDIAVFQSDSPAQQMTVRALPNSGWRVPMQAMAEARDLMLPTLNSADDQTLTNGALSVLQSTNLSPVRFQGRVVLRQEVLAVATVDGSSYMAFFLAGPIQQPYGDLTSVSRIALSADDLHYELLTDPPELGGVHIALPGGLLALRPRNVPDADESLLIAPDSDRNFYRLRLSVVSPDQLRKQWLQQGVAAAKTASVDELIAQQMKARYATINHRSAPADLIRTLTFAGRSVQVAVLDDAPLRRLQLLGVGQRQWWASALDEQHVLMLEVLADVRAIDPADHAAATLVANARIVSAGGQVVSPSENPSP